MVAFVCCDCYRHREGGWEREKRRAKDLASIFRHQNTFHTSFIFFVAPSQPPLPLPPPPSLITDSMESNKKRSNKFRLIETELVGGCGGMLMMKRNQIIGKTKLNVANLFLISSLIFIVQNCREKPFTTGYGCELGVWFWCNIVLWVLRPKSHKIGQMIH